MLYISEHFLKTEIKKLCNPSKAVHATLQSPLLPTVIIYFESALTTSGTVQSPYPVHSAQRNVNLFTVLLPKRRRIGTRMDVQRAQIESVVPVLPLPVVSRHYGKSQRTMMAVATVTIFQPYEPRNHDAITLIVMYAALCLHNTPCTYKNDYQTYDADDNFPTQTSPSLNIAPCASPNVPALLDNMMHYFTPTPLRPSATSQCQRPRDTPSALRISSRWRASWRSRRCAPRVRTLSPAHVAATHR